MILLLKKDIFLPNIRSKVTEGPPRWSQLARALPNPLHCVDDGSNGNN